jgi:hypothetical protein
MPKGGNMSATRSLRVLALVVLAVAAGTILATGARAEEKTDVIPAAKLAEVYATDPAAFDKTYKGKKLQVEGVVELPKAQDSISKKDYVMLKGFQKKGDSFPTLVRCEMTKDLEGLKAGQTVRVEGTCRGHVPTLAAAELTDCKLVKDK